MQMNELLLGQRREDNVHSHILERDNELSRQPSIRDRHLLY